MWLINIHELVSTCSLEVNEVNLRLYYGGVVLNRVKCKGGTLTPTRTDNM